MLKSLQRASSNLDNVKILVGDEVEILESGDLKIGEATYECSSVLRERFKTRKNNAVKAYKAGHGNGNDIAYLSLDVDGKITKFLVLNTKPHIEVLEKGSKNS